MQALAPHRYSGFMRLPANRDKHPDDSFIGATYITQNEWPCKESNEETTNRAKVHFKFIINDKVSNKIGMNAYYKDAQPALDVISVSVMFELQKE